jgi:uncharacterized protein YjbI with pentapeptide repeats
LIIRSRDLAETNLEGTNLSDAYLRLADPGDANLKDAKLSRAYLYHTDLSHRTHIAKCCPA